MVTTKAYAMVVSTAMPTIRVCVINAQQANPVANFCDLVEKLVRQVFVEHIVLEMIVLVGAMGDQLEAALSGKGCAAPSPWADLGLST